MQNHITTSIVLYGKIDQTYSNNWSKFYNNAKEFTTKLGFSPTHIGIYGQSFKTGEIKDINKIENKLVKSLEKNEETLAISIYSLPENFSSAAFDYEVYISLENLDDKLYMLIATFKDEIYNFVDERDFIEEFSNYIKFEAGQIFKLSNLESPQIYASKANSLQTFKTLEILKDFSLK
ncbi:hypothetical protein [Psychrobacillus sp. MER TA 171]|uniref:hypothetical protein n=1 Tax=Psychrobacillus sp. MER TA 171 TaxID=2939577 RepID=UPI00203F60CA|nr:hypothetical protein [Psychrobacillus sp. MER TA 171]MCM3359757.1 hypothetical protein [Psychrobacillus sp. MER TA 171]